MSKKKVQYSNDIYTLDFETTSLFYLNEKWSAFDPSIPTKEYKEVPKAGCIYLWGMTVKGAFEHGRTLDELKTFLLSLSNDEERIIIYSHNLGFEFHWLLNIIDDLDVFARKPRRPIKAYSPSLNIEFRCSYFLTNLSLEKVAIQYDLPVKKLTGTVDYNVVRHPNTKLSRQWYDYLKNDCLVIHELITKLREEYQEVRNIPITQTGIIRRKVVKKYPYSVKKSIASMKPRTFEEFDLLVKSYSGGYTHANPLHINQLIEIVRSYDITSSYPSVMLHCDFPVSRFMKRRLRGAKTVEELLEQYPRYCHIFKLKLNGVSSKCLMNYLSISKCLQSKGESLDNGKVVTADTLEVIVNEIDYSIIKDTYDIESIEILEHHTALKGKLPNVFRKFISNMFIDKQEIGRRVKEDKTLQFLYNNIKSMFNSLYGMCVTNEVKDEVLFINGEWSIKELDINGAEEQLEKLAARDYKAITSYGWGCYITSHARRKIYDVVIQNDYDVVYIDTDSIKFIGKTLIPIIIKYNKKIQKINAITEKDLKLKKGALLNIGEYEEEEYNNGCMKEFKTLGAKKYCYLDGEQIKITLAGVNKKKGVKALSKVDDFKPGLLFNYDTAGKMELYYIEDQPPLSIIDDEGIQYEYDYPYSICGKPNTYLLNMTDELINYSHAVQQKASTELSILSRSSRNYNKKLL